MKLDWSSPHHRHGVGFWRKVIAAQLRREVVLVKTRQWLRHMHAFVSFATWAAAAVNPQNLPRRGS